MKIPDLCWRPRIGAFNRPKLTCSTSVAGGGYNKLLLSCLALIIVTYLLVIGNVELNPGPPSRPAIKALNDPSYTNEREIVITVNIRRSILSQGDSAPFQRQVSTQGVSINAYSYSGEDLAPDGSFWLCLLHKCTQRYWVHANLDPTSPELRTPEGSRLWKELVKGLEFHSSDHTRIRSDLHFLAALHAISTEFHENTMQCFQTWLGVRFELKQLEDDVFVQQLHCKVQKPDQMFLVKVQTPENEDSFCYQAIVPKLLLYEDLPEYGHAMLQELTEYDLLKKLFDVILTKIFVDARDSCARMLTFANSIFETLKEAENICQVLEKLVRDLGREEDAYLFLFPLAQLVSIELELEPIDLQELLSKLRTQMQLALNDSVQFITQLKKMEGNISAEEFAEMKRDLAVQTKQLEDMLKNGQPPSQAMEEGLQRVMSKRDTEAALAWIEFQNEILAIGHENTGLIEKLHAYTSLEGMIRQVFQVLQLAPPLNDLRRACLRDRIEQNLPQDRDTLLDIVGRVAQAVNVCTNETRTKLLVTGHNFPLSAAVPRILDNLHANKKVVEIRFSAGSTIWLDCDLQQEHFHGKNVTISADLVVIDCKLTIDVSGKAGKAHVPAKAASGEAAGSHGGHGDHGHPGKSGGHVRISAKRDIVNLDKLTILCNGGAGGAGQHGGDGAPGENGDDGADGDVGDPRKPPAVWPFAPWTVHGKYDPGQQGGPGSNGGNAGRPGCGGYPGFAGSIQLKVANVDWNSKEPDSKPLRGFNGFSKEDGTKGSDGNPGVAGKAGHGGHHGMDAAFAKRSFWKSDKWKYHRGKFNKPRKVSNWFDNGTEVDMILEEEKVLQLRKKPNDEQSHLVRNVERGQDGLEAIGFSNDQITAKTPIKAPELAEEEGKSEGGRRQLTLLEDLAMQRIGQNQLEIGRCAEGEKLAKKEADEYDAAQQEFQLNRKNFIEWQQNLETARNMEAEYNISNNSGSHTISQFPASTTNQLKYCNSLNPPNSSPSSNWSNFSVVKQNDDLNRLLESLHHSELSVCVEKSLMTVFNAHPEQPHGSITNVLCPIMYSIDKNSDLAIYRKKKLISHIASDYILSAGTPRNEFKDHLSPLTSSGKDPQGILAGVHDVFTTLFTLRSHAKVERLLPVLEEFIRDYAGDPDVKLQLVSILKDRLLEWALEDCLKGESSNTGKSGWRAWIPRFRQRAPEAEPPTETGTDALLTLTPDEGSAEQDPFEVLEDDVQESEHALELMYEQLLHKLYSICEDLARVGGYSIVNNMKKAVSKLKKSSPSEIQQVEFFDSLLEQICHVRKPSNLESYKILFQHNSWSFEKVLEHTVQLIKMKPDPNSAQLEWFPILQVIYVQKFQERRLENLRTLCLQTLQIPAECWSEVIEPYVHQTIEAGTEFNFSAKICEYKELEEVIRSCVPFLENLPVALDLKRLELVSRKGPAILRNVQNLRELAEHLIQYDTGIELTEIVPYLEVLPGDSGTRLLDVMLCLDEHFESSIKTDKKTNQHMNFCKQTMYNRIRKHFQEKYSQEISARFQHTRNVEAFQKFQEQVIDLVNSCEDPDADMEETERWNKHLGHTMNCLEVHLLRKCLKNGEQMPKLEELIGKMKADMDSSLQDGFQRLQGINKALQAQLDWRRGEISALTQISSTDFNSALNEYVADQTSFGGFLKLIAAYFKARKEQQQQRLEEETHMMEFLLQTTPRYLRPTWQWKQKSSAPDPVSKPPDFNAQFQLFVSQHLQGQQRNFFLSIIKEADDSRAVNTVAEARKKFMEKCRRVGQELDDARVVVLETMSAIRSGYNRAKQLRFTIKFLNAVDDAVFQQGSLPPFRVLPTVRDLVLGFWNEHFSELGTDMKSTTLEARISHVLAHKDGHHKFKESWFRAAYLADPEFRNAILDNGQMFQILERHDSNGQAVQLLTSIAGKFLDEHFNSNPAIINFHNQIEVDLLRHAVKLPGGLKGSLRFQLYTTIQGTLKADGSGSNQLSLWTTWVNWYSRVDAPAFLDPALKEDYWTIHFLIRVHENLKEEEIASVLPATIPVHQICEHFLGNLEKGGQSAACVIHLINLCLTAEEKQLLDWTHASQSNQSLQFEAEIARLLLATRSGKNPVNEWRRILRGVYSDGLLHALIKNTGQQNGGYGLKEAADDMEAAASTQNELNEWWALLRRIIHLTKQFQVPHDELATVFRYGSALSVKHLEEIVDSKLPCNWLHAVLLKRVTESFQKMYEKAVGSGKSNADTLSDEIHGKMNTIDDNHLKTKYLILMGDRFLDQTSGNSKQVLEELISALNNCDTLDTRLLELLHSQPYLAHWKGIIDTLKYARLDIPLEACSRLLDLEESVKQELVMDFAELSSAGPKSSLDTFLTKFETREWVLDSEILQELRKVAPKVSSWTSTFKEHMEKMFERENKGDILLQALRDKTARWSDKQKSILHFSEVLRRRPTLEQVEQEQPTAESIKNWVDEFRSNGSGIQHVLAYDGEILHVLCHAVWIWSGQQLDNKKKPTPYIPRDTQILAVLIFLDSLRGKRKEAINGQLGQIATGEGKTLTTAMLAIALALAGSNVNIITSASSLAVENWKEAKGLYALFRVSVHNICDAEYKAATTRDEDRAARFKKKVLYGDAASFQNADLRTKHLKKDITNGRNPPKFVLIDEADSTLLDKAGYKLYISHMIPELKYLRDVYIAIWGHILQLDMKALEKCSKSLERNLKTIGEEIRGQLASGQLVIPNSLRAFAEARIATWIQQGYEARLLDLNVSFIHSADGTDDGQPKVTVVDNDTGEEEIPMQFSFGLAQMLQLKFKDRITQESLKAVYTSNLCYFKQFTKKGGTIFGITGTLGTQTDREFLLQTYGLESVEIPRFRNSRCIHGRGTISKTKSDWLNAIKDSVLKRMQTRAILIICENRKIHADIAEDLKASLPNPDGVREYKSVFDTETVNYFRDHKLRAGDIIVSTNLGGRGTDFKISEGLKGTGGLHVIVAYMPPNERVLKQALGRTARADDPGSAEMIVLTPKWATDLGLPFEQLTLKVLHSYRDMFEFHRISVTTKTLNVQIEFEDGLFQDFTAFKQQFMNLDQIRLLPEKLKAVVEECLQNRWAIWLDSVFELIQQLPSEGVETKIRNKFEIFKIGVENRILRPAPGEGMFLLAGTFPELLRLAKQYEECGRLEDALKLLDKIIETEPNFSEAAFYYKGILMIKQERSLQKCQRLEHRKAARVTLKTARAIITKRIEAYIKTRTHFITKCLVDLDSTNFNQIQVLVQIGNEIDIMEKHLLELDAVLGQELIPTYLKNSVPQIMDEAEATELHRDAILNMQEFEGIVKPYRVSKKLDEKLTNIDWPGNLLDFKTQILAVLKNPRKRSELCPGMFSEILPTSGQFLEHLLRHKIVKESAELHGVSYMVKFNGDRFQTVVDETHTLISTGNLIGNKLWLANHRRYERDTVFAEIPPGEADIIEKQLIKYNILYAMQTYDVSKSLTFSELEPTFKLTTAPGSGSEAAALIQMYNNLLQEVLLWPPQKIAVKERIEATDIPLPAVSSGREVFNYLVEKGFIKKPSLRWLLNAEFNTEKLETKVKSSVEASKNIAMIFRKFHVSQEQDSKKTEAEFKLYKEAIIKALTDSVGSAKRLPEIDVNYIPILTKYYTGAGAKLPAKELLDVQKESFDQLPQFVLHVPWWKSKEFLIGMLGVLQIGAGVCCLGLCPTFAVALISEGFGDILYAVEGQVTGREITWQTYGMNKVFSVCMSAATMGLAAWSGGATTMTLKRVGMEITEEVGKLALRKGVEWSVDRALNYARESIMERFRKGCNGIVRGQTIMAGVLQGYDTAWATELTRLRGNIRTLYATSFESEQARKIMHNSIQHLFSASGTLTRALLSFAATMASRIGEVLAKRFQKYGLRSAQQLYELSKLCLTFHQTVTRGVTEFLTFGGRCLSTLNTYMQRQIQNLEMRRQAQVIINKWTQPTEYELSRESEKYVQEVNEYLVNGFLNKLQDEIVKPRLTNMITSAIEYGVRKSVGKSWKELCEESQVHIQKTRLEPKEQNTGTGYILSAVDEETMTGAGTQNAEFHTENVSELHKETWTELHRHFGNELQVIRNKVNAEMYVLEVADGKDNTAILVDAERLGISVKRKRNLLMFD